VEKCEEWWSGGKEKFYLEKAGNFFG